MGESPHVAGRERVLAAIETQIGWCRKLESPFTAEVLACVRDNVAAGGPLASLVVPWPGRPTVDALALRLAGALHSLARSGREPALAACYPPAPRTPIDGLAAAIDEAVTVHSDEVRAFLATPPQT